MCRINGQSLLIKINKDTTKRDIDDIFAIAVAFMSCRY
ncbi:hypothetical protein WP5S18E01_10580 [Enterobacter cloacae]|nr:hypothetical protein WP5S18E01_10580 [Enterobacter cloacae]